MDSTKIESILADNPVAEALIERFTSRKARVGIVGLGYVGLPFAVEKGKVDFEVIGFDKNPARVAQLNDGVSYIDDISDAELAPLVQSGKIRATTDFDEIEHTDVVVICVPTPLSKYDTPDLSYIEAVTRELSGRLRKGMLVSLESTTYPGTTEEVMQPILEEGSGLVAGKDFFLVHSPERVDPGNQRYTTKNTNKVVGGINDVSLAVGYRFYKETINEVVTVHSAKAAELVKVFENTFRAVNIALVNELAQLADRMDLDVWDVLDAAFTKPFGIMPFYPGPGVGGHCIPIDPHYLEWKAKEFGFQTRFISVAAGVNRSMPGWVVDRVARRLNHVGKALSASNILVIGVSYKRDIADMRESPQMEIFEKLLNKGAQVVYHDPLVSEVEIASQSHQSVSLSDRVISEADLVLILTDHRDVDYDNILEKSQFILDTRNVYGARRFELSDKLELL